MSSIVPAVRKSPILPQIPCTPILFVTRPLYQFCIMISFARFGFHHSFKAPRVALGDRSVAGLDFCQLSGCALLASNLTPTACRVDICHFCLYPRCRCRTRYKIQRFPEGPDQGQRNLTRRCQRRTSPRFQRIREDPDQGHELSRCCELSTRSKFHRLH